jgi:hypothetical protein
VKISEIQAGMKFGKWTAVSFAGRNERSAQEWNCTCECGTTKRVNAFSLVYGKSASCRRCHLRIHEGARFGMWTVTALLEKADTASRWMCRCDCGTERALWSTSLYSNTSGSCGCRNRVAVRDGMKKCAGCKAELPTADFYETASTSSGLTPHCRSCVAKKGRRQRLRSKYNISEGEYDRMRDACGGRCEICGASESESHWGILAVDHCHSTGKVRGLLCTACNTTIGRMRDDAELLRKAADYLERNQP